MVNAVDKERFSRPKCNTNDFNHDQTLMTEYLSFLIIGAGSRGHAYASALKGCISTLPIRISGIAEPIISKREAFLKKHIRQSEQCHVFDSWQDYVKFEKTHQENTDGTGCTNPSMDGVFVCVLDEMHEEVITALAPLGLNIMSEKPLATTLFDCIRIFQSLKPPGAANPQAIFSIGHVLRYSPHNILLRKLLLEKKVIGDVLSIEHTEPVGWWHFSHSYVRWVSIDIHHVKADSWKRELAERVEDSTVTPHKIMSRY